MPNNSNSPSRNDCRAYANAINHVKNNSRRHELLKKMGCTKRWEEYVKAHTSGKRPNTGGGKRRNQTRRLRKGRGTRRV